MGSRLSDGHGPEPVALTVWGGTEWETSLFLDVPDPGGHRHEAGGLADVALNLPVGCHITTSKG